jgi:hypothetical protein
VLHVFPHYSERLNKHRQFLLESQWSFLSLLTRHLTTLESFQLTGIWSITFAESDAVLEHGTLCLATLAQDFTNKILICQHAGLEQLVKCMNSHDPDIVKSAIEAIALVLQVSLEPNNQSLGFL